MSLYTPPEFNTCIIYLHSINGSRLEAHKNLNEVLQQGFLYATFDFTGSGKSDGNIVTYGSREVYDLDAVIYYIV